MGVAIEISLKGIWTYPTPPFGEGFRLENGKVDKVSFSPFCGKKWFDFLFQVGTLFLMKKSQDKLAKKEEQEELYSCRFRVYPNKIFL